MTIKSTLDKLPPEQKKQLMYAFEHELAQYVPIDNGNFIGVNVDPIKHLKVTERAGVWAIGEIKNERKE